jgi:anti-sigma factor (TIGR02949 family)
MVTLISCEEVLRAISDFLDGELEPDFCARVERHLAECAHCTAILDGARNLLTLVGHPEAIQLPHGFGDRLRQRIEQRQRESEQ